jgi:uncharacterized protein YecE (DUF72 family)
MGQIRIGISGWRYAGWRGVFYPEDLAQSRELAFASSVLPTIEINGSFYSLQRPQNYQDWYDATPPGFVFAHKGNRFITHIKRLRDPEKPLANVLASGVLLLREKLGPFLWQFPPNFKFNADLVEHFFSLLPHDTEKALDIACGHEERMNGRAALEIDRKRPMRHVMEIRNDTFNDPDFVKLLRKYDVALVVADTAGKWPDFEDVTADFMYVRLHGQEQLYASGYTDEALQRWAKRIDAWAVGSQVDDARLIVQGPPPNSAGRDVYCYFDNDIKVHAPFDAHKLAGLV